MSKIVILPGHWNKVKTFVKGSLDLQKLVLDELKSAQVPAYNSCCPDNSAGVSVRFNVDDGIFERFDADTNAWVTADLDAVSVDVVSTDTVSEKTAAAGVTVDGVKLKDGGVTSGTMIAGFYPVGAQQALSGAGALNVTSYHTAWTTTAANAGTLANGTVIGQLKKITLVVDGGDGTLTPASLSVGTTITFNDAGDFVELIWNGTAWVVLVNSGTTIA